MSRTHDGTELKISLILVDLKTFYAKEGLASNEEIKKAFEKENKSRVDQGVFELVSKSEVPKTNNILLSHVIYRWKDESSPRNV